MPRQEVNIGVVGNDGTGDSIREAFRKVNDNFAEIYAIFNLGDAISLQDLDNVPNELSPNRVLTTDDTGIGIKDRELLEGTGISIDVSDPDSITISATGTTTSLFLDEKPKLRSPLNANRMPIANLAEIDQNAVNDFNTVHGATDFITINDLVITKGYADRFYLRKSGSSSSGEGQIRVRDEPLTANDYTIEIDGFATNCIQINGHGFDSGIDGASFTYSSTGISADNLYSTIPVTSPAFVQNRFYKIISKGTTNFVSLGAKRGDLGEIFKATSTNVGTTTGTVKPIYFIKYVSNNLISVHPTFEDAQTGTFRIDVSLGLGTGTHSITDANYNSNLLGNWLANEVIPRNNVVRRQGDIMSGSLTLHDHPYPLQGAGTPNTPYDLQAATKFYVDNSSFTSPVNIYVSNSGNDIQVDTPEGKEGTSWAYAFATIGKACERAEYIMNTAPFETGPYRQLIAYTQIVAGDPTQFNSVVTTVLPVGADGLIRLKFSNNGGQRVDQGKLPTLEIIPGKLIKGRISGATGFIYDYDTDMASLIGEDYVDLEYVRGQFLEGENLEFGDPVKNTHISIYVESGVYEEDYPIRIPANTAVIGDEFRRVLVRPKDRISQSPWVDTWFFRNGIFDDLTIAVNGTQYDPQAGGWFGYHYYKDSSRLTDRGPSYINTGQYNTQATTIESNRLNIQDAIKTFIQNTPGVTLTTIEIQKCLRDVGYIVDAIVYDLRNGGMTKILELQELFSKVTLSNSCLNGLKQIDNHINTTVIPTATSTVKTLITNMIDKIVYGFNVNYNTPKNNKDIDVFLVNDASIIRQITCQGHGGFMMVLDPYGQILSKSPYCQQSGSFAGSINKKSFRGGQYIDGFSGNLKPNVTAKNNSTSLTITNIPRAPLTPTSFFIDGERYKVDTCVPVGDINGGDLIKANKYFIHEQTILTIKTQYPNTKYPQHEFEKLIDKVIDAIQFDITNDGNTKTIEAIRRFFNLSDNSSKFSVDDKVILVNALNYIRTTMLSVLANTTVVTNQTKYSQIKNLSRPAQAGSSTKTTQLVNNIITCLQNGIDQILAIDYPTFNLLIDNETPVPNSFTAPTTITLITPGNTSMLGNDYTQVNDLGYGIVTNNNGLAECVSVFSYYCWTGMYSNNGGQIRSLNSSSAHGEYGLVAAGSDPLEIPDDVTLVDNTVQVARVEKTPATAYANSGIEDALFLYIKDFQYVPYNVSIVEINHGSTIGIVRYEMSNVQVMERDISNNPTIVRLNFTTSGAESSNASGLKTTLANNDKIIIRSGQNFKFSNILKTNPVRPSTALTFKGDPADNESAPVYRVIAYNTQGPDATTLPANQSVLTFDTTYQYILLLVDETYTNTVDPQDSNKRMGRLAGDTKIAVKTITSNLIIERLKTAQMIFAWDGKIHRITDYTFAPTNNYGYVTFVDTYPDGTALPNLNTNSVGLNSSVSAITNATLNPDAEQTLRAGLANGEPANITVRISTMRATGHDFLDIGTGSYNTTNYPNKIYGDPKDPSRDKEVQERGKGRVFYVSTDQDGFFRVGRFFTVDQGTGTVSFSASIALTSLDGIGFKKGVFVTEFSSDEKFTDLAPDAIPTEAAVGGYIDRRLGINRQGVLVDSTELFSLAPGFLDRKGLLKPLNDIDWGSNRITNLKAPAGIYDAVNKEYLDIEVAKYSTFKALRDILTNDTLKSDILVFADTKGNAASATVSGDLNANLDGVKSTLVDPILQSGAFTAIKIVDASLFPDTGYVVINDEIFYYNGRTVTPTLNQLDGVQRLSLANSTSIYKMFGGTRSGHAIGDVVISLNKAALNYQINPDTIINADVKSDAGIVQSKLALQKANTFVESDTVNGWSGSATKTQADLGLAKFSDLNFETVDGYVRIKDGGITRTEQANVTAYRLIGNLTNAATSPQELTPELALQHAIFRGIKDATAGPGLVNKDYVYTITRGANQTSDLDGSTFKPLQVNVSVTADSIVRRTSTEAIKFKKLDSDGGVNVIEIATGKGILETDTPVAYKGQWTPGDANATFSATYATSSGSLAGNIIAANGTDIVLNRGTGNGNDATFKGTAAQASKWTNSRKITLAGDATGEITFDGSADVTLSMTVTAASAGTATQTVASITFNDSGSGGGTGTSFNGSTAKTISYNTIGAASASHTHNSLTSITTISTADKDTAGSLTGAWALTTGSKINFTNGTLQSTTLTTGSTTTAGTITGNWTIGTGSKLTLTDGDLSVGGNLSVTGTSSFTGDMTAGNIDCSTMDASSNASVGGTLTTRTITTGAATTTGTITGTWSLTTNSTLQATYADLAEYYSSDAVYEPGTVVIFGGDAEVTTTNTFSDNRAAGIITTNPAYVMNNELKDKVTNVACLALQGRVPCKVVGRVKKGDMLTTAGVKGFAVKATNPSIGTVLAKALEDKNTDGPGIIEVAVGRL